MPIVGKVWRAAQRRPAVVLDLFRAVAELALARWKFGRLDIGRLVESSRSIEGKCPRRDLTAADRLLIERVRLAVSATGPNLPFRADCLIQALAAQHWLSSHGIASTINIGVRTDGQKPFEAHAWLVRDGEVVTGGDVAGYKELLGREPMKAAPRA